MKIPGISKDVKLTDPISSSSPNFTWGEATHNGERIPTDAHTVANIIRCATLLQEIRNKIKEPLHITSWYRPEPYNTQAGGVSNSEHLHGGAADFYADSYNYKQMYDLCDVLVGSRGGVGKYRNNTITHVDVRGYRARWYD